MQPTAELREWHSKIWYGHRIYLGNIYNDIKNRWPDGTGIHTSAVKEVQEYPDHILVFTRNSIYICFKDKRSFHDNQRGLLRASNP